MAFYRVTVSGLIYGQTHQNVLHFIVGDGIMTPAEIATEIELNWLSQIKTKQVTAMVWTQVIVQDAGLNPAASHTKAVNVVGTNFGEINALPFTCFVIQLRTAIAGRHGRGRFYVSGLTNNTHVNGIVTAATLTAWGNTLTTLKARYLNAGGTSPMELVINPKGNHSAGNALFVTDMVCRQYVGVQRRRNYGVGI